MTVWLNGKLLAPEDAHIAPGDRGFTLGDGLFETLRVAGGAVQQLDAHLARLAAGAQVIGLPLPALDFSAALAATLAANGLAEGSARLTVTRGAGPRGVLPPAHPQPTVLITAAPAPAAAAGPCRLVVAASTRRNEHSPVSRIKSLNYLDNILARQEAAARGADDGVLLNTQGQVAETSFSNLFAVIDGRLLTPPVADGALPGITRARILAMGGAERTLTMGDLSRAEEVFLTTSLGLRSAGALEDRMFSSFAVADRLRSALL